MIRCTIEMVPGGDESHARRRIIGIVDIANMTRAEGDENNKYSVILRKTPPFEGALKRPWKSSKFEDEEFLCGFVEGFHRTKRGSYDLLYLALKACGLESRNKKVTTT